MNWIDRVIEFISPQAGFARYRARLAQRALSDFERKYEGASVGRRTDGWFANSTSANTENAPALSRLRNRSRDLVRNNPYAARAVQAIQTNTIGTGIIPQPSGRSTRATKDLTSAWERWAETTECDADGVLDFYGIQGLVMRTIAESGECLVRRRWRRSSDGLSIPVQLQVLEPDYIDTTKSGTTDTGGYIIQGIEFDSIGRRVAYWLFQDHPGDGFSGRSFSAEPKRVDSSEILHLFRQDRAGQVRGIPWGASVIIKLRDLDELEDAQLTKQKTAACFAAFVHDIEAPQDPTKAAKNFTKVLKPGAIEMLPPGKQITFPSVPSASDDGHSSRVLHAVAMGFGVTYELMTGDFGNVNFSSGRMGWIEFHRNVEQWRWQLIIPRLCVPVWQWFCDAAYLQGYQSQDATASWTPPRREMIDPTREIPAIRDAIRSGVKTLSEAIREQGNDPERQLHEWKRDAELLDKLGLTLDSDPRKVSQAGGAQKNESNDGGKV
ncbi:MAG: phage portal protein [Bdellovibrionales bacterium RIFOXYC1_FULL_54_43]|nr:MAG: phage portal protein [Bdellovibrionales bacterium RIFOXYC1_FULL_54_43]OFZ82666.1 MAG: phage portal protein [Bdellovibrionales bacterium RIFOXYD1_FULL_55_31]